MWSDRIAVIFIVLHVQCGKHPSVPRWGGAQHSCNLQWTKLDVNPDTRMYIKKYIRQGDLEDILVTIKILLWGFLKRFIAGVQPYHQAPPRVSHTAHVSNVATRWRQRQHEVRPHCYPPFFYLHRPHLRHHHQHSSRRPHRRRQQLHSISKSVNTGLKQGSGCEMYALQTRSHTLLCVALCTQLNIVKQITYNFNIQQRRPKFTADKWVLQFCCPRCEHVFADRGDNSWDGTEVALRLRKAA